MSREGLITKVTIKLDELTPPGVALPFKDLIDPLLDESALELLGKAPLYLLTPTKIPLVAGNPPVSLVSYENNRSYIVVPDDYVRLYEIKYPLWKRAVREGITPENPEYIIQDNEYLAAGYGRPFVAVIYKVFGSGSVKRYFECAKVVDPGQNVLTPTALYVKKDVAENLNDMLADALTWLTTSKVMGVLGYADKAKMSLEQATQSLAALVSQ